MISHISPSSEWTNGPPTIPFAGDARSAGLNTGVALHQLDAARGLTWGKVVRDVAAVANSGGGCLVVPADGTARSDNERIVGSVLEHLAEYTDSRFDDVRIAKPEVAPPGGWKLEVGSAEFPIGFKHSFGENVSSDSSQAMPPFVAGAFYFWHDGKSEPATSGDFQAFIERRLDEVRQLWSKEIGRVLSRPLRPMRRKNRTRRTSNAPGGPIANLQPVRIVNDASAPALQPLHVDQLYPWRQKEIVAELNRRLGRRAVTTYDLQAVRRQHQLDERPEFVFHLPGAGRRYSPAAADWMLAQYTAEPEFFTRAHAADQSMLRQRRKTPR